VAQELSRSGADTIQIVAELVARSQDRVRQSLEVLRSTELQLRNMPPGSCQLTTSFQSHDC
jgi:hypothetical protein